MSRDSTDTRLPAALLAAAFVVVLVGVSFGICTSYRGAHRHTGAPPPREECRERVVAAEVAECDPGQTIEASTHGGAAVWVCRCPPLALPH